VAVYYAGLDLGQSAGYTALAVVQKVPTYDPKTAKHSIELHLRYLERYPLKTPYTDIADRVKRLLTGPPFTMPVISGGRLARPATELIVDKTGVGVAVTDLLKERRLNYIAVTITGLGQKVNRHGTKEYSVPKQDLVSALGGPFSQGHPEGGQGAPRVAEAPGGTARLQVQAQAEQEDRAHLLRALEGDGPRRLGVGCCASLLEGDV
jgi:hypothetical protein